ncbi:UNVERIFIED_CONTAM: Sialin [Trichonephila clavipes]
MVGNGLVQSCARVSFQQDPLCEISEAVVRKMKKKFSFSSIFIKLDVCVYDLASIQHRSSDHYENWHAYFFNSPVRRTGMPATLLGPAACMVAIPVVKCNADAVVLLLTSAMALFGLCGGGDVSVIVDLAPDFAGKIFGVSNAIASIPGILSPVVAGYFLEGNKGDAHQWTFIFYISVGMYIFGALVFLIFGSAEVQRWVFTKQEFARRWEF